MSDLLFLQNQETAKTGVWHLTFVFMYIIIDPQSTYPAELKYAQLRQINSANMFQQCPCVFDFSNYMTVVAVSGNCDLEIN